MTEISKEILEKKISEGLTRRQIARWLNCSNSNIVYYFNKFNLITKQEKLKKLGIKKCPCCLEILSIKEFNNRTRNGKKIINGATYCKYCQSAESSMRKYNFTQQCVDYKGGECEICGYNESIGALEFHHKDRSKKDFEIGKLTSKTFSDIVKKELDKCMLLCKNCHGEIHFNENSRLIYSEGIWKIKNDKRQIIK
jgi:hypothetical protein